MDAKNWHAGHTFYSLRRKPIGTLTGLTKIISYVLVGFPA